MAFTEVRSGKGNTSENRKQNVLTLVGQAMETMMSNPNVGYSVFGEGEYLFIILKKPPGTRL